ncbi:MAG: hypothetical protein N2578_01395 [Bdellovibrionaceae bacterium]|nr:hypothetical protein [Pseudobdellovibrionaceae bacterium]
MSNELNWRRYGTRPMTSFAAKARLLELVENSLSTEDQEGLQAVLKGSADVQFALDDLKSAIRYLEEMSTLHPTPKLMAHLLEEESKLQVLLGRTRYSHWPAGLRWTLEAVFVMLLVLLIMLAIPWDRLTRFTLTPKTREIVLAELIRSTDSEFPRSLREAEEIENPVFPDEDASTVEKRKSENKIAQTTSSDDKTAVVAGGEKQPLTTPPVTVGEGFLYRSNMKVTNLKATGPKITAAIEELGGRRAGKVPLGWEKRKGLLYYHFTIPETKYEELRQILESFGRAVLVKEKHPRVMPAGIIRLIIEVEEAGR